MDRIARLTRTAAIVVAVLLGMGPRPAAADEGMWTLDNLPLQQLEDRYGFRPTPEWLEHVQKSCVHFGGGSGAFVSPDGLVMTNHHVALGQLHKLSTAERDYVRDGFFARTRDEEARCRDLELKVLWSMEDVTATVTAAISPQATAADQNAQRKAAIGRLERESTQRTQLKSEVVELYQGGEYWLYRYRTFKDVRMVCAPEEQAAFYGRDLDNFSYPRHDLDFAVFRVYENGQPYRPEHFLTWSASGAAEGDLVFVAGHPGRTSRLRTIAQLEYERDVELPTRIAIQQDRLAACRAYAQRGPEQARQAQDRIRGLTNNLKRQHGFLETLQDESFLEGKRAAETALRARVAADPQLAAQCGEAWDRIARAEQEMTQRGRQSLHRDLGRVSRLVDIANGIVRWTTEVEKPSDKRFKEYRESNLDSQRFQLLSPAPIYPALEEHLLGTHLQLCLQELGPQDAFVVAALGGRNPWTVAHDILSGTQLADIAQRKRLLDGGQRAVQASKDPLVQWARQIDAPYRELRAWIEDHVESVTVQQGAQIARARFALDGKASYPDATGTLRLSYGTVAGYTQLTTMLPWKTTFLGLYDRAASFDRQTPFELPARVDAARSRVTLECPLNFVSTNDIIGGNSGSPVLDRAGEYVGLVFDGNIQAFVWDYGWSQEQARCVSVDSRGLIEALRNIYDMGPLADELTGAAIPTP